MKLFQAALLLSLAGAALAQPADPGDAAADARIVARMRAFPTMDRSVEAVAAYLPAEAVPGGGGKALKRTTPARAGLSVEAIAAADALAEAQQSFALIVMRDGRVVQERYWQGMAAGSRFSTASMHKTVMALAFGIAAGEGRIGLDDRLGKHLPAFAADPRGDVTLRQLLQMASGLALPQPAAGGLPSSARLMFSPDSSVLLAGVQPVAAPGTVFSYANSDSQLAGDALTRAVGRRYAAFLSQRLWKPLGAADAGLWLDSEGGRPHQFCCLQATARDWARIGELIRLKGRVGGRQLVPANWIEAMAAPSPLNPNYGLQLWRGSPHSPLRRYSAKSPMTIPAAEPFAADDVLFLDGAGGQRVYVVPSKGLTIVRIGRPAPKWDDSALPNLILRGLKESGADQRG